MSGLSKDTGTDAVFRAHAPLVAMLCRRMLGPGEDAQDAAQDVWAVILSAWQGFRGESAVSTWIWRIAVRTLLARKDAQSREGLGALRRRYHVDQIPAPPGHEPHDLLWVKQTCERCLQGVAFCLEPLARAVFLLRVVFNLDYREISRIVDRNEAGVRQLCSRARRLVGNFIRCDCALSGPPARCRCGMDQAVRRSGLLAGLGRLESQIGAIQAWLKAQRELPVYADWIDGLLPPGPVKPPDPGTS